MQWLDGLQIERWLADARSWALPRLAESGGLLVLTLVVWFVARWGLSRIERDLTSRTRSELDDHVVRLLHRAVSISVLMFALHRLALIWELPTTARLMIAVWIVALSVPVSRFLSEMLELVEEKVVPKTDTTLDDTALPLVNKVLGFVVIALAVMLALSEMGIDITPVVAGAGVAGLAVSLAAKDTLSNLIAGVLLILDRPFQVGDRIELWTTPNETGTWGDVIEIGLRATKIRNPDNIVFVVPNNEIMRRDIVNYTASGDHIRVRIPIDIAYDADAETAKKIILEVVEQCDGILDDPAPQVIIRRFGESGVGLQLRVWIHEARRRRAIADEITDRVKHAFDERGLEIPYPKRDLYIRGLPGNESVAALSSTRGGQRRGDGKSDAGAERPADPVGSGERASPPDEIDKEKKR